MIFLVTHGVKNELKEADQGLKRITTSVATLLRPAVSEETKGF